jgi:translocator protein
MTEQATGTDKLRAVLVLAATIGTIAFNWLAAIGRVGGVTPEQISNMYQTPVTPAGYAFSIWSLIYLGLIAFSIYQLLPANIARFRSIRSLYIITCVLNCAWIYFWHSNNIAVCMIIISALLISLLAINMRFSHTDGMGEYWFVKAPFSIYFGWVTAATLVNFAILLVYLGFELSQTAATTLAVVLLIIAGVFAVAVRKLLHNYLYPLAIAWAATAIAVKQSGQTAIVLVAALVVVACLIATLSFVVNLPSTDHPRKAAN